MGQAAAEMMICASVRTLALGGACLGLQAFLTTFSKEDIEDVGKGARKR